jgi:hypothetical protein
MVERDEWNRSHGLVYPRAPMRLLSYATFTSEVLFVLPTSFSQRESSGPYLGKVGTLTDILVAGVQPLSAQAAQ